MSSATTPEPAPPFPEAIELAERWREAGKILAARAPEVFEEMLALFATWLEADDVGDRPTIDKIYLPT
jgi:hypothetical protein